jgi:hypothetical protein
MMLRDTVAAGNARVAKHGVGGGKVADEVLATLHAQAVT